MVFNNLRAFYDNLEEKQIGLRKGDPIDGDVKDEMQIELEKIFMQFRKCFNDVINCSK